MFTNTTVVPSTNHAPAYNMGTPPTMYQYQTATAQLVYPNQQYPNQQYPNQQYPPGVHQGYHGQQFYPMAPSAPGLMPQPTAPSRY